MKTWERGRYVQHLFHSLVDEQKDHRVPTCEHFTTAHLTSHQQTSFYSLKWKL